MDPLAPFARNDRCWCGSDAKYKACHGAVRPRSIPGEPIGHEDDAATIWLSPNTSVARSALVDGPQTGAWFSIPTGRPQTRPVSVPPAVKALLAARRPSAPLPLSVLGAHRFDLYDHVGGAVHRVGDRDALAEAVSGISVAVLHALTDIAGQPEPRPTVLSNDEVEPARLLGQTLLWADHVCVSDRVFDALIDDRSDEAVQDALAEQYALRPLIEAGAVVPVPAHLGVAVGAQRPGPATPARRERPDRA